MMSMIPMPPTRRETTTMMAMRVVRVAVLSSIAVAISVRLRMENAGASSLLFGRCLQ
jgi:hypothetical protein